MNKKENETTEHNEMEKQPKKAYITFSESVNLYSSSDKKYLFYTNIDILKKGDVVILHTTDGLTLGIFHSYADNDPNTPHKWIISKADTSLYDEIAAKENRMKELRKKINERKDIYKSITKLDLLCQFDSTLREYTDKLNDLSGENNKPDVKDEVDRIMLMDNFV